MSALDRIHKPVRTALIKDGWNITHDPYRIRYDDLELFADLAAERALAAERDGRRIAVEVKSFLSPSPIRELEQTIGQYIAYRELMEVIDPSRKLIVAIGHHIWERFFQRPAVKLIVDKTTIPLLVVHTDTEEIVQWIR